MDSGTIGNTNLEKYEGDTPNGNTIWIKREFDNPYGSHYDRVYRDLFKHYEENKKISPGGKVIETTSGAAGVSFAGIGKELGYDCYVVLPEGGEKARERAIIEQLPDEDHLILTPKEDYVNAFPKFLRRFLARNRDYFFLNHSMGKNGSNNEVTLSALEEIAREIKQDINPDYFIPAMGNGSSVLGPGRIFVPETKVIPFETFQSAVAYDLFKPGEYEATYGIKPGTLSRHRLPGTSYRGIEFPHVRNSVEGGILDKVVLVSDIEMDEEYRKLTGRTDTTNLVHWDSEIFNHVDFGRSTRAGINVALDLSKSVKEKDIVLIGYDKANRYDSKN